MEGGTTRTHTIIKSVCHTTPNVLRAFLSHLTLIISEYIVSKLNLGPTVFKYLTLRVVNYRLIWGSAGQNPILEELR